MSKSAYGWRDGEAPCQRPTNPGQQWKFGSGMPIYEDDTTEPVAFTPSIQSLMDHTIWLYRADKLSYQRAHIILLALGCLSPEAQSMLS